MKLSSEPRIKRAVFRPFLRTAESQGVKAHALLAASGLPEDVLAHPEDDVEERRLYHLADLAARGTDIQTFGLLAGLDAELDDLGVFGLRLQQSLTVFHALVQFCETVNSVSTHAHFWIERQGEAAWFSRAGIDSLCVGEIQAELFVVATMTKLVRLGAGPNWCPEAICLKSGDTPRDELPPGFREAKILCSQPRTAIRVREETLSLAVQPRSVSPTICALRTHMDALAPGEVLDIVTAAELAGCSTRTLQRVLGTDGLTWRRVLDQARFKQALAALGSREPSILDVALDCGYSDQAHFSRAFQRWTGLSPGAYRRRLLQPAS
jgi:AraC-like DNA-binding protein